MRITRNFKEVLHEALKDPIEADAYLNVAIEDYAEDGNTEFFNGITGCRRSSGGLSLLAKRTKLNGHNLDFLFSGHGNPRVNTIDAVLRGLGFKLTIQPLNQTDSSSHVNH